ncbi:cytochrome c [Paraburkholderia sp. DHOC27]|uniref:c-type cytochrome n=1 Tax=Paraburkholderia sp. DHOC27 TaxID=2303330 RepID=UPI000E3B9509|nr:cytochrome c [Paraburkholderia sp. DHOC27]RFU45417.1 cytochrome c [Paraburkholderia sp. DHOC27]
MHKRAVLAGVALMLLLMRAGVGSAESAAAEDAPGTFTISPGYRFTEQSGAALYRASCAGCHMPDGKGAQGAGHYPALAGDPAVEAAPYVIVNVLHGHKGMPAFGDAMSDAQVAAVVNYTRTHLGNHFDADVTPDEVKSLR